jgi:hypothetical protein
MSRLALTVKIEMRIEPEHGGDSGLRGAKGERAGRAGGEVFTFGLDLRGCGVLAAVPTG